MISAHVQAFDGTFTGGGNDMDLTWILIGCALIVALYIVLFRAADALHRETPGESIATDVSPKI